MSPIVGSFTSGNAFGRKGGGGVGIVTATGGTVSTYTSNGISYKVHTFTSVGNNTFTVTSAGTNSKVEVLLVGGGGPGGGAMGGGGGAGAVIHALAPVTSQSYTLTVGDGGKAGFTNSCSSSTYVAAQSTTGFGITATGGGQGSPYTVSCTGGANGGGGSCYGSASGHAGTKPSLPGGVVGTVYAGNRGGSTNGPCWPCGSGGGGGAAAGGTHHQAFNFPIGDGGAGVKINITGTPYYWGGGGGGNGYNLAYIGTYAASRAGNGGVGGGGGGACGNVGTRYGGFGDGSGLAWNNGANGAVSARPTAGGAAGANTGGGGGGGEWSTSYGGNGGSGIIIVRYPTVAGITDDGSSASPFRSAATIKNITSSGNYWIQTPSMSSATQYYVDNSIADGPWIRVMATSSDYNTTSYSWPDAQTPNLINDSQRFLYCFLNPSTNAVTQAWHWWFSFGANDSNFAAFKNTPPMGHGGNGSPLITKISSYRISEGVYYDSYWLRTGYSSFGSACDDGRSGTWGQLCLKAYRGGSSDPGTGQGGLSDFPHYATYAAGTQDHCSQSNETYSTTSCSATRVFAIYVRI